MNYIPLDWADLRLLIYICFIKFRIAANFGQNRTLFIFPRERIANLLLHRGVNLHAMQMNSLSKGWAHEQGFSKFTYMCNFCRMNLFVHMQILHR
jgi:hypothetical protein